MTERGRIDAIVSGVAIASVALGATRVVLRALYRSGCSNSPSVPGFDVHAEGLLGRVVLDPLFGAAVLAVVTTLVVLRTTRFGLHVRVWRALTASAAGIAVLHAASSPWRSEERSRRSAEPRLRTTSISSSRG